MLFYYIEIHWEEIISRLLLWPRLILLHSSNEWILSNLIESSSMLVLIDIIVSLANEPIDHSWKVITFWLKIAIIMKSSSLLKSAILETHLSLPFLIYYWSTIYISLVSWIQLSTLVFQNLRHFVILKDLPLWRKFIPSIHSCEL